MDWCFIAPIYSKIGDWLLLSHIVFLTQKPGSTRPWASDGSSPSGAGSCSQRPVEQRLQPAEAQFRSSHWESAWRPAELGMKRGVNFWQVQGQTSDNMDRWSSRGGKSQKRERTKKEDQRKETVRRKKIKVREKVEQPQNTVLFHVLWLRRVEE
jgi:hypothetical protein